MNLYRLRKYEKTVGYMKINASGRNYYSKDMYGWHGQEIEYTHKDMFTGFKDRNNRCIFEHDIIHYDSDKKGIQENLAYVKWSYNYSAYFLIDVNTEQEFLFDSEIPTFYKNELLFKSHIFINEELFT